MENNMITVLEKGNSNFDSLLIESLEKSDVINVRDFLSKEISDIVRLDCYNLMRQLPNRVKKNDLFYSMDVLPTKVETNRIFRTIEFHNLDERIVSKDIVTLFEKLKDFQSKFLINNSIWKNKNLFRRFQVIHYPKGGGFFDWHQHPRFPVNFGMILNLSGKGIEFNDGATEIVSRNGKVIRVEDFSDKGDLILFRYDLKHRVAPCDQNHDLCFDSNGRWTAILPIF